MAPHMAPHMTGYMTGSDAHVGARPSRISVVSVLGFPDYWGFEGEYGA